MLKLPHDRATFGSCDVEKVQFLWREAHFEVKSVKAPGARTTFDDSMAIRNRKSARRCGEKHIWKSKVLKTEGFEPLLRCQLTNLINFIHLTNN